MNEVKKEQGAPEATQSAPTAAAPKAAAPKAAAPGATAPAQMVEYKGSKVPLNDLLDEHSRIRSRLAKVKNESRQAVIRRRAEKALKPFQAELIQMQKYLEQENKRVIILFEGRDASGKGGTIRRVSRYMNEKHYRIVALGKPTEHQRTQWFFQRYVETFPHGGEQVLFDRSWYNRAMVEQIFGFCTQVEYENFMAGVVGFEKDIVRQGTILVKLYFSVTKDEQARRFERRKTDPLRQWKLSEIDVQAQDRWDEFTRQKYEMMRRTHTSWAPWTVIRSNNKQKARLNAMKVILNAVPYERLDPSLDFVPDSEVVVSGARELEIMEAQMLREGRFTN